jgi:nitroreductase
MEFDEVISTRKSVRKFSEAPVEQEKLEQILESARLAPSWANKQGWRFVVVQDPEKLKKVSKAAGVINVWLKKAPVIVLACGDKKSSGLREGIHYIYVDVSIAMEHLVLAAANQGLGTCWVGAFDEQKMKDILGIPEDVRVIALTPVGYPAEKEGMREKVSKKVMGSKKRKPLEEIVFYDSWKN